MWSTPKLREHAKEILKECEKRGYTIEETEMLPAVLKDELYRCSKELKKNKFTTPA